MTETEGPSLISNTARKTFVFRHDTRAQRLLEPRTKNQARRTFSTSHDAGDINVLGGSWK